MDKIVYKKILYANKVLALVFHLHSKRYFSDLQNDVTNLQESIEDKVSVEEDYSKNKFTDKKK